jgi:alcohol dehydrogenase (cytochrome c)
VTSRSTSRARCHPGAAGTLSPDDYLNVTAYILAANSAQPGDTALSLTTAAAIGSVASGTVATAVLTPPAAPAGAQAGAARPQGPPPPRGHSVRGEVKNYVPVTDEMLRNPPPGDWLMARRNYQAWSHSPLTEITRANVKHLRLAWVWSMNEGGANQPMPLVHDGIMYLTNTMNMVQALDAATGELIWENQVGPNQAIGFGSMRNLAIYQDKIFLATTDAKLVALDARTGAVVWTTVVADRAKGFSNTSGPIVIKGKVVQGLQGCDRYREERCMISAYDAETGKLAWKFHTIAHTGEPGGDTWGTLPDTMRQGGDTWIVGSYDPDLDLTYWGIAQAKPWMPASRGNAITDASLYGASTVALRRAATGRSPGTTSTSRPRRWTTTRCSSACSSTSARTRWSSPSARPACCGSSTAGPAASWVTAKRCSRTCSPASTRDRRARVPRGHQEPEGGRVDHGLPQHRGRP